MSTAVHPDTASAGRPEEDRLQTQRLNHDVRQSLAAVMSLVAVVDHNLGRGPEVLRRLDQIRHETEVMIELVSRGGRPAEGAQPGSQPLDVGDVVTDVWESAAATSDCRVRLVRDAGARAAVDEVDLRRAVRNLLDNAVRAAGHAGAVVVHVRTEPRWVAVAVGDDGPGFGKVPTQHGLGLVTVRRFAHRSGGSLEVRVSRLGGAELVLRLPRCAHREWQAGA